MTYEIISVIIMAVNTSFGVCTPRYIRENPIRTIRMKKIQRQDFFRAENLSVEKRAVPLCVCPLGKEYPVAAGTADATG